MCGSTVLCERRTVTMAETGAENVGRCSPLVGLPQDFPVDWPLSLNLRRLTVALIK